MLWHSASHIHVFLDKDMLRDTLEWSFWVGVTFCKNLQHVPIPASRSHLSWHWTRRNCGLAGWARSETGRWTCPVENGYNVYYCTGIEAFDSRTLIVYYFVWLVGFLVWDFQLDKKFSAFEVTTIFITVFKKAHQWDRS
jgi:hypothetical protein